MKLYIRCYALKSNCWDDGIGFMVAAEKPETIDSYMSFHKLKDHPWQQFLIDTQKYLPYFYGDVITVIELKND